QKGEEKVNTTQIGDLKKGGIRQHQHHLQAPAITRGPSLLLQPDTSDMTGVIDSRHKPDANDGADQKLLSRKRSKP
ncbi:unnamed protein product, partial [Arabidopsis halleri]